MTEKFSTKKRIKRKRNFLIHFLIYLAFSAFFTLLNLFTYNQFDGWWFMFPMIPLGLILSFHFIFTIGKDYAEIFATRWEAREQGRDLNDYIEFLDDVEDKLDINERPKRPMARKNFLDEDFV